MNSNNDVDTSTHLPLSEGASLCHGPTRSDLGLPRLALTDGLSQRPDSMLIGLFTVSCDSVQTETAGIVIQRHSSSDLGSANTPMMG